MNKEACMARPAVGNMSWLMQPITKMTKTHQERNLVNTVAVF